MRLIYFLAISTLLFTSCEPEEIRLEEVAPVPAVASLNCTESLIGEWELISVKDENGDEVNSSPQILSFSEVESEMIPGNNWLDIYEVHNGETSQWASTLFKTECDKRVLSLGYLICGFHEINYRIVQLDTDVLIFEFDQSLNGTNESFFGHRFTYHRM